VEITVTKATESDPKPEPFVGVAVIPSGQIATLFLSDWDGGGTLPAGVDTDDDGLPDQELLVSAAPECTADTPTPAEVSADCACYGGLLSESSCQEIGGSWTGDACVFDLDEPDCSALAQEHHGDSTGDDVYNLGLCCQHAPTAAECLPGTPPPGDTTAGACACYGGFMDPSYCTQFDDPWVWTGSACQAQGIDVASCDALTEKHHGNSSGNDIYNIGVCCQIVPEIVM
jgi:hypothetical protein